MRSRSFRGPFTYAARSDVAAKTPRPAASPRTSRSCWRQRFFCADGSSRGHGAVLLEGEDRELSSEVARSTIFPSAMSSKRRACRRSGHPETELALELRKTSAFPSRKVEEDLRVSEPVGAIRGRSARRRQPDEEVSPCCRPRNIRGQVRDGRTVQS